MADKKKPIFALQSRRNRIDQAVENAQRTAPKKKKPAPKNPYPAGSARAKLWQRKQKAKGKDNG